MGNANYRDVVAENRRVLWRRWTPRLGLVATCIAAALPILVLVLLLVRYAVPVPALDDWEMAPLIAKAHAGDLTIRDLFEQQQEARTFFPKLIFVLLGFARRWDVRAEMALSIVICCAIVAGLSWLLHTSRLPRRSVYVATVLSSLLVFSPAQLALWLLASGFPSFV